MAKKKLIRGVVLSTLSIIFLILPIVILCYIKRDKYFIEDGGSDISMGFIVGMLYVIAMLKGVFKDFNKHLSRLVGMAVALAVVWFFNNILDDLFWIVLASITGYVMYAILSTLGRIDLTYHKEYRSEKARIDARSEVSINGRG